MLFSVAQWTSFSQSTYIWMRGVSDVRRGDKGLRVQLVEWTRVSAQHVDLAPSPSKPLGVSQHLRNIIETVISACIAVKPVAKHT